MTRQDSKRSRHINIRVPNEELERIDAAARRLGKSRTRFLVEAALGEAEIQERELAWPLGHAVRLDRSFHA